MERLLERDDELASLESVLRDAIAGRGSLVLLGGEAGIGKTSLVRALQERAPESVAFLAGACEPLSVPVPLAPLRELAEAAGALELVEEESADRLELARRLLAALEARAPALAVVEDAHWADPTTLDVVRLLSRRLERTRVALLLTYRDDEVAANPPLEQLLGDLATRPSTRRLRLRPLSTAAVQELAAPAGVDAAQLARVTGGNPFLVVEAVAAPDGLPASVRDATLARVGRLGPEARGVVEAAATAGHRVAPSLLEAIAPGSAGAVEEALARGVLVADGAQLGFRHELLRDAVEASISPLRRAELHGRVLAALLAEPDGAANARLAHHAELAGLAEDACRYAMLAAADAERVGAMRETFLQSARALRLGRILDDAARADLLVRASHAANFSSLRLEDAAELAEEAIALARRLGDPVLEGRSLVALAYANWSLDRVPAAKSAADRAVRALEGTTDVAALVRASATRLRIEATKFDPGVVVEEAPRALELAAGPGLDEARIDLEISLGLARGHRGEPDALERLARALEAARRAGLAIQTVRTYVNLVFVAAALREHALVDRLTPEALDAFDELQTTIPGYAVESYRARSLLDRGRWDEARLTLARRDRTWASETPAVLALDALIGVRRGEAGAVEQLERAWDEVAGQPESSRDATIRVARVEASWIGGDAAAPRRLREALDSPATRFVRQASELALWASRLGVEAEPPPNAPEPVLRELAGDWRGAIRAWKELEAPYDAALAALPGDDRAAREALAALHRLGAEAAARAFVRERSARAGRAPRGPRRSTLAHAAGLTRREQEILGWLATGATNAAIAARLHLSERTVAHHVSAILGKLGAANRLAAVESARGRGLLAQDGPPAEPT